MCGCASVGVGVPVCRCECGCGCVVLHMWCGECPSALGGLLFRSAKSV